MVQLLAYEETDIFLRIWSNDFTYNVTVKIS